MSEYSEFGYTEPQIIAEGIAGETFYRLHRQFKIVGEIDRGLPKKTPIIDKMPGVYFLTLEHKDGFDYENQIENLDNWRSWFNQESRDERLYRRPNYDYNEHGGTWSLEIHGEADTILNCYAELNRK